MARRLMEVRGSDGSIREPISDYISLKFTAEVSTLPLIEFEIKADAFGADGLEVDGYITTPIYMGDTTIWDYVIKDIKLTNDGTLNVYAIQNAEALKNEPIGFFTAPGSFAGFINRFNSMMNSKGWLFVIEDSSIRNIQCSMDHNNTVWNAMLEIAEQAGARWYIEQRGSTQYGRVSAVVFYSVNNFPKAKTIRMFDGINLKAYEREHNTNDVITKICPLGKDRLMLNGDTQNKMEVPPDECWITDTSKYNKIVPAWVEFGDVENVDDLRASALAYIQTVNAPYISYSITAVDLSRMTNDDAWDEFDVGTYVEFLDKYNNVIVSSHIAKITLDLINPENNQMEISTTAQSFINSTAEERRKTADAKKQSDKAIEAVQNMVDYIIEEDTAGIYHWRKWASGKSEVWGYYRGSNTHYSTLSGWYARYFDWAFPEGLFVNRMSSDDNLPNAQFTAHVGTGFSMTAGISYNSTPNTLRTYVLSSASGAQTCAVWLYAEGKWK